MPFKWIIWSVLFCSLSRGMAQTPRSAKKELSFSPKAYFISRKHSVYAIGDSSGWYANSPRGDSIFHVGNLHFAVRNNNRYVLYNEKFDSLYTNLSTVKEFGNYIFIKDSVGWLIYSPRESFTSEHFDSLDISDPYVWVFKNGKQGLLKNTWSPEEYIAPAYDKTGPYCNGTLLINEGKLGWKGVVSVPLEYDHIYLERPDILAAKNNRGTVYYSLKEPYGKLLAEPGDSVVFYDGFYKKVRGKLQSVFLIAGNIPVGESDAFELHPFEFYAFNPDHDYCIAVKDSLCALFKKETLMTSFEYSNFLSGEIRPPYFVVIKNKRAAVIDEHGKFQLQPLYTDVLQKWQDYYIVRQGQSLGLRYKNDSVILTSRYNYIAFTNDSCVKISQDGKLFGLYDLKTGREIIPPLYDFIDQEPPFIIASRGGYSSIYYKEELKMTNMVDAECNENTIKGYKNGKVYIGYVRHKKYDEYSYEIPSYKVVSDKDMGRHKPSFNFSDVEELYDFPKGKWGYYSFTTQEWKDSPLIHSGDNTGCTRLLPFYKDSVLSWHGMNFQLTKLLSPIEAAWQTKSRYPWIDAAHYVYTNPMSDVNLNISPICYKAPGKGHCMHNYGSQNVNTVFNISQDRFILTENGKAEISSEGDVRLSDFICRISSNGSLHPKELSDYEKLIDRHSFVSFRGANEHIFTKIANGEVYVPYTNSYEWLSKNQSQLIVARSGNLYGLLSPTGSYLLNAEFQSIQEISNSRTTLYKVGQRSAAQRLYNPKTKTFSALIYDLQEHKGGLLLCKTTDGLKVILNTQLDTLLTTKASVGLLGGNDFNLEEGESKYVYRDGHILFSYEGQSVERINSDHFLLHKSKVRAVVNTVKDTVFKSEKPIKYADLGDNYLLDDGREVKIFDKNDKSFYFFDKTAYVVNTNKDLIVKKEKSTVLLKTNASAPKDLNGTYVKHTANYVVVKRKKNKAVYDYRAQILVDKAREIKILNDEYLAYQEGKDFYLLQVLSMEKKKIKNLNVNLERDGIDYETLEESTESVFFEKKRDLIITEKNGLFGLAHAGKTVLPCTYFQIQPSEGLFLVQEHLTYGLFNAQKASFAGEGNYDLIKPYKTYFMTIKRGEIVYLNPFQK